MSKPGNKNAVGNKGGARPTEYGPKIISMAKVLCELGATDPEIARALGVEQNTFDIWKVRHPELNQVLKLGKEPSDERAERSLFQRATGYNYKTEEIVVLKGEIHRVEVTKHVPPDANAAYRWLLNRRPGQWRNATVTEVIAAPVEDAAPVAPDREVAKAMALMLAELRASKPSVQ